MSDRIMGILCRHDDPDVLWAVRRIEELEQQLAQDRKATSIPPNSHIIYICARCGCFAEVPFLAVEVFDSGTTLICSECGEATVFDLSTPENYAEAEGLRQQLAASIETANINAAYWESSTKYAQAARIARQQLHAECRITDELQACRLRCEKTKTGLRQELQEAEAALSIAMGALKHCETAAPDLTGDVLDVIEKRLTPEALARICEYELSMREKL